MALRLACALLVVAGLSVQAGTAAVPTAKALRTRDRDIKEQFGRAVAAYTDVEFVAAERLFRDLSGREGLDDHDREVFLFMVGKCLYAQGEYAYAIRHFDEFRSRFPESSHRAAAAILTGHSAYRNGDILGAAREYARALSDGPAEHRTIARDNLRPLIVRGLRPLDLEFILKMLEEDAHAAVVRYWIADRWASAGRRSDAIQQFRLAVAASADTALANRARARAEELEHPSSWSLTIGVMAPLTGDFAAYGHDVESAVRLASSRWGEAIRITVVDTHGDPLRSAWAADSLIDIGCEAVIGPLRADCIAATVATFRAHDIVQVLPVARRGGDEVTALSPHLFALSTPPDRLAVQLLRTAMRADSMSHFAAFIADSPEGRAAGRAFAAEALNVGATMYPIHYFTPATLEFARPLRLLKRVIRDDMEEPLLPAAIVEAEERARAREERMRSEEALDSLPIMELDTLLIEGSDTTGIGELEEDEGSDALARWRVEVDGFLIWADPEDILQIVPQARALGFDGRFLGNAAWGVRELVNPLRQVLDSVIFVSDEHTDRRRAGWGAFAADFQERTGREPGWLAGRSFDAVNWLAQYTADSPNMAHPLERLGDSREFTGVCGTYRFAPDRQPISGVVYRYAHGRPVRLD